MRLRSPLDSLASLILFAQRIDDYAVEYRRVGLYAAAPADDATLQPGILLHRYVIPKNGFLNYCSLVHDASVPDHGVLQYFRARFYPAIIADRHRIRNLGSRVDFTVFANPHMLPDFIHGKLDRHTP